MSDGALSQDEINRILGEAKFRFVDCGYLNEDNSCNLTLRCEKKGCGANKSNRDNVIKYILRQLDDVTGLLKGLLNE